jgi:hypothetical protein
MCNVLNFVSFNHIDDQAYPTSLATLTLIILLSEM